MRRYIFLTAVILMTVIYVLITVFGVSFINLWRNDNIHNHIGEEVWLTGRVVTLPALPRAENQAEEFTPTMTFVIEAETIDIHGVITPVRGRVQVRTPATIDVNFGDRITGWTELAAPMGARFEGGFDFANHLRQQDVYVTSHMRLFEVVETADNIDFSLTAMGIRIRQSILSSIDDNFSGMFARFYPNDEVAGIVKSIMVGERSGLTHQVQQDFSRSGIGHILAVSGMHVGILFSLLSFLLIKLRLRKTWQIFIGIFVLLLFMAVALYTPSVTRATIMMVIFLLAYIFQRQPDQLTSLGLAAIVIIVINPYSVMSASFLLSFGAVTGILLFYPTFNDGLQSVSQRLRRKTRFGIHKYVRESLALSASTWVVTVFITASFFNIVTFGGFLTNLVAMPIVAFIMVGGFVVWAVSWIPIVSTVAAYIVAIPVVFVMELARLIASLPVWFFVPTPNVGIFALYVGGLAAVYILTRKKQI